MLNFLKLYAFAGKLLPVFGLLFILHACNSNQPKDIKQTSDLLADRPIILTHADSVTVGKKLPLSFFTDTVKEGIIEDVAYKTSGIFKGNTQKTKPYYSVPLKPDTIRNIKPFVKKAKPYISYASHPAGIKAGEWRNSATLNENIQCLGVEQGLSSATIYDIKEDNDGFIWLAHPGGLTRYDGSYFYNYTQKNGLVCDKITEILIDKNNTLWLASPEGLIHFDGKKFETYTTDGGLFTNDVNNLAFDLNGDLWFTTTEGSVCKLKNRTFTHYNDQTGLKKQKSYVALNFDSLGRTVISSFYQLPTIIDGDVIYDYPSNDNTDYFGSRMMTCTYRDKNGYLWIGSYNHAITRTSPNSLPKKYSLKSAFGFLYTTDIIKDHNNNLWVGTSEGGVINMKSDSVYDYYTTLQGLGSNMITCLFEDKAHNIWVGTATGGLSKITPASFKIITSKEGFSDKQVSTIFQDSKGLLYFGTWADGVWILDANKNDSFGQNSKFTCPKNVGGAIILDIIEKNNSIYICGHQYGIQRFYDFNADSLRYTKSIRLNNNDRFDANIPYKIELDSKGNIWLADVRTGLWHLRGDTVARHYTDKNGLITTYCSILCVDENDNVWVNSGESGISFIEGEKITHFTTKNGLPSNKVKTFFRDSQNTIWIGTDKGLCYYRKGKFTTINATDGLMNENITSIVQDNKKRLWIGTGKGLFLMVRDESAKKGYSFLELSKQDALQGVLFYPNSSFIDRDNTLWMGSSKGLVKINLNEFENNNIVPRVRLTQIDLMESYVDYNALNDSISLTKPYILSNSEKDISAIQTGQLVSFYNYPKTLVLPYDINSISFKFSAMDGIQSSSMQYRYKLEGRDKHFNNETSNTETKYDNLSYGTYVFVVQARVQNGKWGKEVKYTFTILPPFWHTWWFRILATAIFLTTIGFIFRIRNRQLLKRQHMLEETVTIRTKEIQDQKILVEEKQKEIVDSINYAKRIQQSQLPTSKYIDRTFKRLKKD